MIRPPSCAAVFHLCLICVHLWLNIFLQISALESLLANPETPSMRFISSVIEKLQRHPKRIVFPEGEEPRVLQAARQFRALGLGAPIILGDPAKINNMAAELSVSLQGIRVINPIDRDR